MLVKAFVSVRKLVKPSTVSKPVPYTNVHNVRNISSISQLVKILMLLNLSLPVTQLILSFVIPLVTLFLILLVVFSQRNLFINLLMRNENVFMNNLLLIKTNTNMIWQNQLVSWIFWLYPYIFMSSFTFYISS